MISQIALSPQPPSFNAPYPLRQRGLATPSACWRNGAALESWIQLVLRPRRGELVAEMLITGQAANCRRVEPSQGAPPTLPLTTVANISRCNRLRGDDLRR